MRLSSNLNELAVSPLAVPSIVSPGAMIAICIAYRQSPLQPVRPSHDNTNHVIRPADHLFSIPRENRIQR